MKKARIKFLLLFMISGFIFSNSVSAQVKEKDLLPKYQEWLKLVSYIVLPLEREVFLKLASDWERDIFIETFWKQRDPTPGTPQNEFKEEHLKRFNYANQYFRRGTPREGWMTDLGRMYIILGAPSSTERFDSTPGIHPCQVWYYYGDRTKGLPTYFALVFFQRSGSGEYKLYNPTSDGPLSLIVDSKGIDLTDYQAQFEKIKELAPTLANVSVSMIPGQYPFNFMPSPQNNIILADIYESPKKYIKTSYATHFLSYRGVVSTEYMTNFIESAAAVAVVKDPVLGVNFCHFALSPKNISVDYYAPKDQYYCNFKIDVSLRRGEQIIFQYSKDFPFYFPPDRLANVQANGVAVEDSFPVIEGRYGLTVLLQNSVGREFSILEKEIDVAGAVASPRIVGPVLGYRLQDFPSPTHMPFKFMGRQLEVDPDYTFSAKDEVAFFFSLMSLTEELWREGVVEVLFTGQREKDPARKSLLLRLQDYPFNKILGLAQAVPAQEFPPDYYEIQLLLKNGRGETVDEAKSQFVISPVEALPHPVTVVKSFPLSNSFLFYYTLAYQYGQVNEADRAEANFEKALLLNPEYKDGFVGYADFLLKAGKFDRSLEAIEKVRGEERRAFDYFLIKGRALEGKGEYAQAIDNLLEANKIYNSDVRVLNSLGFCYFRTGQKKAALDALKASLRLNPEQKEVSDLAARVEKELK